MSASSWVGTCPVEADCVQAEINKLAAINKLKRKMVFSFLMALSILRIKVYLVTDVSYDVVFLRSDTSISIAHAQAKPVINFSYRFLMQVPYHLYLVGHPSKGEPVMLKNILLVIIQEDESGSK
jgi:hypothetical protein